MNQRWCTFKHPQIHHKSDEVGMVSGATIAEPQVDRLQTMHDCR
jgi:hypothetical protein